MPASHTTQSRSASGSPPRAREAVPGAQYTHPPSPRPNPILHTQLPVLFLRSLSVHAASGAGVKARASTSGGSVLVVLMPSRSACSRSARSSSFRASAAMSASIRQQKPVRVRVALYCSIASSKTACTLGSGSGLLSTRTPTSSPLVVTALGVMLLPPSACQAVSMFEIVSLRAATRALVSDAESPSTEAGSVRSSYSLLISCDDTCPVLSSQWSKDSPDPGISPGILAKRYCVCESVVAATRVSDCTSTLSLLGDRRMACLTCVRICTVDTDALAGSAYVGVYTASTVACSSPV